MHFGLEGVIPLVVYVSSILVFLASIFWRPQIGVYYVVFLLPLQTIRHKILLMPLGNKLIDMILLAVLLGVLLRSDYKFCPKNKFTGLLLPFAIFLYVSLWQGAFFLNSELPWSVDDPRFSTWKNYMVMPFLLIIVLSVIKERKQIKILVLLMCVSTLLADKSIYSTMSARNLDHFSYGVRYGGAFGYAGANGAGAFEAWFTVFLVALFLYEKRKLFKVALLGLIAAGVYCLMVTFSRGAYAGFLLGLLYLGIVKSRKLLLVILPVILMWQLFLPRAVQERITSTYDESSGTLESSAAERVTIWDDAMEIVPRHPIFGTGFETYFFMHRVEEFRDTHNYFLKVLLETGVVGLLFFLVIVGRMWSTGFRLFRTAGEPFSKAIGLGITAGLIALMVANCFGDRWLYIEETGFLWVLVGCALRAFMFDEQEKVPTPDAHVEESEQTQAQVPLEVTYNGAVWRARIHPNDLQYRECKFASGIGPITRARA